jgi:L-asparagine transporter-like permease
MGTILFIIFIIACVCNVGTSEDSINSLGAIFSRFLLLLFLSAVIGIPVFIATDNFAFALFVSVGIPLFMIWIRNKWKEHKEETAKRAKDRRNQS